jgi:prephenate dehydrogenase
MSSAAPDLPCLAIYGPGLLGGSLALATRRHLPRTRIQIWARKADALAALPPGLADTTSTDPAQTARGASLLVLCCPVPAMPGLAAHIAPALAPGALLTDVGSVKAVLETRLPALLPPGTHWLGGHPMAGSELSGFSAARAGLFDGAVTFLTPTPRTAPAAVSTLSAFWSALGARVHCVPPDTHDRIVAEISHLPHLVAALLAEAVEEECLPFAGSGFRDTSRVAAGSPDLWRDILAANRPAVIEALDRFARVLDETRAALRDGDDAALCDFLASAARKRQSLRP